MRKANTEYHVSLPFHRMQTWDKQRGGQGHSPFTSAFMPSTLKAWAFTQSNFALKLHINQIPSEQVHLNVFNFTLRLIIAEVYCIILTRTVMPFKFLFSSCLRHALDNFVGQLRTNARHILWINAFPEPQSQKVILQMANEKCLLWSVPGISYSCLNHWSNSTKKGLEKCYFRPGLSFL